MFTERRKIDRHDIGKTMRELVKSNRICHPERVLDIDKEIEDWVERALG